MIREQNNQAKDDVERTTQRANKVNKFFMIGFRGSKDKFLI